MKISILIVDDEYYICENIRSKIELLDIKEIGEIRTCYSGEEALEICKSYKPEIIITDIKMEEMNGIELIHVLKKILYPAFFIVLSGYDDYKYVRNAFQEGVTDYLLKPVLTEQLSRILHQQCEKLMDKTSVHQESRSSLVLTSEKVFALMTKIPDAEDIQKLEQEITRFLKYKEYMVMKIGFDRNIGRHKVNRIINTIYDMVSKESGYQCMCAARTEQKVEVLLNSEYLKCEAIIEFWEKLIVEITELAVGNPAAGVSTTGIIQDLFRLNYECENNLCYRLTEGYGKLFWGKECKEVSEISENLKKHTLNLMNNTEFMSHTNIWKQIERSILRLDVSDMKRYNNYLLGLIYSGLSSQKEDKKEIDFPSFYEFVSAEDFIGTLKDKTVEYAGIVKNHENPVNIIDNIREYIDTNFTEKLVLSEIADKYFISYSYLSKMFRETCGVSFQEYLISKRMVYAEQLLQCQTMSLQEIADAVGYNNVFNFSRAFKKYFGASPAYYRRK